jgi:hypothetical protein
VLHLHQTLAYFYNQNTTMITDPYPFLRQNRNKLYIFDSQGKNLVKKIVQFSHIEERRYNLGLADIENGRLDFQRFTNNGDSWKVLNTVAAIVIQFFEFYPDAEVEIRAAGDKRLHLYNRIFENRIQLIETVFKVTGFIDYKNKVSEPFQTGKEYEAFLVQLK